MATQLEILKEALSTRNQEVLYFQINIDNYTAAIAEFDANPDADLADFRKELVDRLAAETREQKKVKLMRSVIQKQVDTLTAAESA